VSFPRPGIDLRQWLAALLLGLTGAASAPVIEVNNEAGVPPAELESILKDFRAYAARVYAYNHVANPAPVKLRLTRKAPFGFYEGDTVLLPPSNDRIAMLDDWVHELTHHATGHESSFFFKEGIAVHTLETLFGQDGRVPADWPQFGQTTDAWVAVYRARGQLLPLRDALAWESYRPDDDFHSWQIYNLAGSFVGWYIGRYGYDEFRKAFAAEWPAQDSRQLEREWLAAIAAKKPAPFDPAQVLPHNSRYQGYIKRLTPP